MQQEEARQFGSGYLATVVDNLVDKVPHTPVLHHEATDGCGQNVANFLDPRVHVLDNVDELIGLGPDFLSKAAEARRAGLQIGHADSVFIRHPQCHMASGLCREPIGLVVASVIQCENWRKLVQIDVRILDVLVVGEPSHSFDDERRRSRRKHLGDALQQGLRPAVYRNLWLGLRWLLLCDDALAGRRLDETRSEAGQISLHREPAASDRLLVILAFERQPTGPGQCAK